MVRLIQTGVRRLRHQLGGERQVRRIHCATTLAVMVTLFLGMGWSLVSCSGSASEWRPAKTYSLLGMSMPERLETLRTVGANLPISLFYLGDPYAGMPMTSLIAPTEPGSLTYSLTIMYRPESAIEVVVILFTTEQFAYADPVQDWTPVIDLPSPEGREVIYEGSGSSPRHYLVATRGDTAVLVWGQPDIGAEALTKAATEIVSVAAATTGTP